MAVLVAPMERELCAKYRAVFSTPNGREVFTDMMLDLGFLAGELSTPESVALGNYARLLLYKIGAWQDHNIRGIVDKLFELPTSYLEGGQDAQ